MKSSLHRHLQVHKKFLQRGREQPAFGTYLGRKWTCIGSKKRTITKFPLKWKSKGSYVLPEAAQETAQSPSPEVFKNGLDRYLSWSTQTLPRNRGEGPHDLSRPPTQHYDYTIPRIPTAISAPKRLILFIFLPQLKIPPLQRNFVCSHFFISSLSRHNDTAYTPTFRQAIYFCFSPALLSGMFTFKQCIKQHYLTTFRIKNVVQ